MKPVSALTLFTLSPALALAHPGHGLIDGWAHYLNPEHALPAIAVVAVVVYLIWRKKERQ